MIGYRMIGYSSSTRGFYDPSVHGDDIPADVAWISREEHAALLDGESHGKRIVSDASGLPILADPPPPTSDEILAAMTAAVQALLDAEAKTRSYDGILSACTYATSTVERFRTEGQACVAWRDAVWATCYAIMDAVNMGQREIPTREVLLAELPAMVWPGGA